MAYCDDDDVRKLNGFPDETVVDEDTVSGWCEQRAGELNVLMLTKGVTTPVTAPPDLLGLLKLANTYGAAAMLAAHPGQALGHEELKGLVDVWLTEFVRLERLLSDLTKEQLVGMGVVMTTFSTVTRTPPGMALAASKLARPCGDWRDAYPYIRAEDA